MHMRVARTPLASGLNHRGHLTMKSLYLLYITLIQPDQNSTPYVLDMVKNVGHLHLSNIYIIDASILSVSNWFENQTMA